MSQELESAKRIIERNDAGEDVVARLGLPIGFITEKGSAYNYLPNGQVHRDKFDGTQHEQGIAVFIPDTDDANEVLTSIGVQSGHLSPDERFGLYVTEANKDIQTGEVSIKRIFATSEVSNPDGIYLVSETPDGVKRRYATKVELKPQIGYTVFEMDKLPNGGTNRHPGHKVTEIVE